MSTRSPLMEKLFALDQPEIKQNWLDCQALGISPADVPELIDIVLDERLNDALSNSAQVWMPVHAWRALAQLHAAEAAEPLTTLLRRIDDNGDDWVGEEMPRVFGLLGPPAIPVLSRYLRDVRNPDYARVAAIHGLQLIGTKHPGARDEVVAVLSDELAKPERNGPTINGFLISFLIDLNAHEAAPLMERAYAAGCVDLFILGDWEDAQVELGLKFARESPRPPMSPFDLSAGVSPSRPPDADRPLSRQAQRKAERKATKAKRRRPQQ